MEPEAKIYVAGHQGLVGCAIRRRLQTAGLRNLVGHSLEELDLRDQAAVSRFFDRQRPEYVFLAAARVKCIRANSTFPVEFRKPRGRYRQKR
jgi:GDP-L-fucose synthase